LVADFQFLVQLLVIWNFHFYFHYLQKTGRKCFTNVLPRSLQAKKNVEPN